MSTAGVFDEPGRLPVINELNQALGFSEINITTGRVLGLRISVAYANMLRISAHLQRTRCRYTANSLTAKVWPSCKL